MSVTSSLPLALLCLTALAPLAAPSELGFVAHFSGLDEHGFGSSQSTVVNVPSGGVAGVGEGYLRVALDFPANLGAQTALPALTGSHVASGATGIAFWLRDIGNDDNLQIHVGVGESGGTFFLSNQGINPPADRWQRYTVSFENPSAWTRIKGNGSFADALATADRLLFRHDVPPLNSMPNDTIGDFGVDRISVMPCAYEVYGTDAGGSNVTVLDTAEASTLDTTHTWVTRGAVPSTTGFLLLSPVSTELPIFGGSLLVDPALMLMVSVLADGTGGVVLPLAVPNDPALAGLPVFAQMALADPGQPKGWAFGNGLSAVLCQ